MQDLPKGWTIAELKDVGTYINGRAFKPNEWQKEGLPIVRIQNLNNPDAPFNYSQVEHEAKYKINNGDLLVAWSASLGVYIWSRGDAWLNQHIFRVEVNTELVTKETLYFLLKQAIGELYLKSHGTGMVHVTKPVFESHTVPLPPLNEQHRIVAKLEKLLSKVNSCGDRLDKIPTILKRFRQSVLAAACSGRLTADWRKESHSNEGYPKAWKTVSLGETITRLHQGWSPKCEIYPSCSHDVWGVIKTTAIQPIDFIEVENKQLPPHLEPKVELEIKPGDVLITRAGPRVRAGVTCFVDSVRPKLILCDKAYRFRANSQVANSKYLVYFLNCLSTVSLLDELKTGISDSGVNLTQKKFLSIPLLIPPLAEQEEIVRRVEALFHKCDQIEARYQKAKAYTDKLTQAILAKSFRGELVPQDPNDEPAEVLLERIKAEKEAATTKPPKITKKRGKKASSPQQTIPGME
jgi:type I restriction enzyme S subunit